ncbi:serine/threonine protein kinase [Megalodesulfovibrio gigas]|uniref:serine/threonine protein kinase n=1 Tax=Megalodesulfovibrio gigas TaxID=879 RepID=UPI0004090518|nr:serine/threonine-protein kinase [Megalodesulfovibrio gigas]
MSIADSDHRIELPKGTILGNDYRIEEFLGRGGFGLTYKAADLARDEMPVAIKQFAPMLKGEDVPMVVSKHLVDSILIEAVAQQKLSGHPSIPRMLHAFPERGTAFLVMEWVQGRPLHGVAQALRMVEPKYVSKYFGDVLLGIRHIIENKLVHRDISPNNIMIQFERNITKGTAKLIDFGTVGVIGESSPFNQPLAIGTPPFIAPERLRGEAGGPWSDLYSAAVSMLSVFCPEEMIPQGEGDKPALEHFEILDIMAQSAVPEPIAEVICLATVTDPKVRWENMNRIWSLLANHHPEMDDTGWGRQSSVDNWGMASGRKMKMYIDPRRNRLQRALIQSFDTARFHYDNVTPQIPLKNGKLLQNPAQSKIALARAEALVNVLLGREIVVPAGQVAESPAFMCIFSEIYDAYTDLIKTGKIPESFEWRPFRLAIEDPTWKDYVGFTKNYRYTGAPTVILRDAGVDEKSQESKGQRINAMVQLFVNEQYAQLGAERRDTKAAYGIDFGVFARNVRNYFRSDVSVFRQEGKHGALDHSYAEMYRKRVFDEGVSGAGLADAKKVRGIVNDIEKMLMEERCSHLRGNWYFYAKRFEHVWPLVRGYFDTLLFLSLTDQYNVDHVSLISQEMEYGAFDHSLVLGPRFSSNFFETDPMSQLYGKINGLFPDKGWGVDWLEVLSLYSNPAFRESVLRLNAAFYSNDIRFYAESLHQHVEIVNKNLPTSININHEDGSVTLQNTANGRQDVVHQTSDPVLTDEKNAAAATDNATSVNRGFVAPLINKLDVRLLTQDDTMVYYALKPYKMFASVMC